MPNSSISDERVEDDARELYRHTNFLPTHLLIKGAEGTNEWKKEMEIISEEGKLEGQFTIEAGEDDHNFHTERTLRFESGLKAFLAEISGGNLTEGEAREIFREFFDKQEYLELGKENQDGLEAK